MTYSQNEQTVLLDIAHKSIEHGLIHGKALVIDPQNYPESLRETRATFVTLEIDKNLRGCIGTLTAYQPLICDVAQHAFAAAFNDPRFAPLTPEEFNNLSISISVLSPAEEIHFDSEKDLLKKIRPGVDGLILAEGIRRGTFLPAVWEDVPTPEEFLRHLKIKAGLPENYWSKTIKVSRYTTDSFS